MAVEKNYLNELFKVRGLEMPTSAQPMIGTGLVPVTANEVQVPGDERFMSSLAALLYNVEPIQDDLGQVRFDKSEVLKAVARVDALIEEQLNEKLKRKHLRVHVMFIPVARDRLLPGLVEGRGDIAAANLTITPARQALVDFAEPWITGVSEIVVTGPASPRIGR